MRPPDQTFSFSGGTAVTVYGYFVVDSVSGLLLWSERFASPITVQNNGDSIVLTLKITLSKV